MLGVLRRYRNQIVLLALLAVGLSASILLLTKPGDEPQNIRNLLQKCAVLYNARDWEALSRHAWPESEQAMVRQRLQDSEGLRIIVVTPVELGEPRISGDQATIEAHPELTMVMGRIRDRANLTIRLVKEDGRWMVDAASMSNWQP